MRMWIQINFIKVFDGQAFAFRDFASVAAIRILICCLACFDSVALPFSSQDLAAQSAPIVLRDLTLIRGERVSDFDDRSVVISDGTRLTWDQILKASVDTDRQKDFDLKIKKIGLPLFRLKSRIHAADWISAGEIAEPIYETSIANGTFSTNVDTTYLVCLATMKSRIAKSDRARALEPFFIAAELQPKVSDSVLAIVGGSRIPPRDREQGLSRELLPVWFDDSKLKEVASGLAETLEDSRAGKAQPHPSGLTVYLASLKIELGQSESALGLLRSMTPDSDADLASWRTVLEARLHQKTNNTLNAQTMLEMNAKKITGTARPVALYYRGINVLNQQDTSDLDRSKAILTLLRIPALFGNDDRELAAAAIYQAAEIAKFRGRQSDEQKLRDELLRRYAGTYHGSLEANLRSGR